MTQLELPYTNKRRRMNKNSLAAYCAITPELSKMRQTIADAVREWPESTAFELSERTKITINRITGRLNELEKLGVVVRAGKKKNPSGHSADTWCIKGSEACHA